MSSPEVFSQRMGTIASKVPGEADKIVRKAALAAAAAVITATPVKTGRARANWLVGLNGPITEPIEDVSPSGGEAISNAAAKISRYTGGIGRSIWLSNNLPYIGRLNEGYSAQAPAHYVETAIRRAVAAVKGAKLLR